MSRKQTIIIFPHLNDCGGNLSKDWYVEWKYRIPGDPIQKKERVYKELNTGTLQERYKKANKIIEEKKQWLKSGAYLQGNESRVYEDELVYRNEARLYGKQKNEVPTIRKNISEYLAFIKPQKTPVTFSNIQTNMRIFNAWLERNKLNVDIKFISRNNIIEFLSFMSNDEKRSRATIKGYKQDVANFFEFEIDRENIIINPVRRIPQLGQIVDCSVVPFTKEERTKLKKLIAPNNPQLWLAFKFNITVPFILVLNYD